MSCVQNNSSAPWGGLKSVSKGQIQLLVRPECFLTIAFYQCFLFQRALVWVCCSRHWLWAMDCKDPILKIEEEKRFKWKRNHCDTLVGFTACFAVFVPFLEAYWLLEEKKQQTLLKEEKPGTRQMFTQSCVTVSKIRNSSVVL